MEHSLHQQLKALYARPNSSVEVLVDGYRVDAVSHGWLVEIQQGPLWAIRKKTRELLKNHYVLVVKPIVIAKQIVRLDGEGGAAISRRRSPKVGQVWDIFQELVHFTKVFPHPRLRIDVALVDIVEYRYPRRRRTWRVPPYHLADRGLVELRETITIRRPEDLRLLLPPIPEPFDTAIVAKLLDLPRWRAQQIAYCLREMGATEVVDRSRRGWQYVWREVTPDISDQLALQAA